MKKYTFKTRHALLMSMISLMTCFAMLFGATFAWFTDSVTSGVNRIVAGNLDVELYHVNSETAPGALEDSKKVDNQTQLFRASIEGNKKLWEPGAMAYETFTVKNVGSLALKYQMAFNKVGNNFVMEKDSNGDYQNTGRSLLDVLRVGVIDGALADGATRSTVAGQVTAWTTLKDFNNVFAGNQSLAPGANGKTFTVVLYWPSDTESVSALTGGTLKDNDYNLQNGKYASDASAATVGELYVNLGITLVATQESNENDSFGNTYDQSANTTDVEDKWAGVAVASAAPIITTNGSGDAVATTTVAAAPTTDTAKQTTVTLTAVSSDTNAAFDENSKLNLKVETNDVKASSSSTAFTVTDEGSTAVASIDLTLTKITTTTTGTEETQLTSGFTSIIDTYVATGLNDPKVAYNGDASLAFGKNKAGTKVNAQKDVDAVGEYWYDSDTGHLVFMTDHYSQYYVTTQDVAYIAATDTAYQTLPEACIAAAAAEGDVVVTLLRDAKGDGWSPDDGKTGTYTLDFAGHTYDVTGLVGSTNTRTQAWRVISGQTATLKNGTLTSSHAYMLINQYGNLTLDNMIVDGSKMPLYSYSDGTYNYTLSNNSGTTTIKNGTVIKVVNKGHAFDVYGSYNSKTKTIDVIVEDGVINGIVEFDKGNGSNSSLNISGGDFTNATFAGLEAGVRVSITGGTFNSNVSNYCAEGYTAVPNAESNPTSWTVLSAADAPAAKAKAAGLTVVGTGIEGAFDNEYYNMNWDKPGKNYADAKAANGLVYRYYQDGKVYIQSATDYTGTELTVKDVDGICMGAFSSNTSIKTLTIAAELEFGVKALNKNTTIKTVEFANGVARVNNRLVYQSAVETVVLPNSITTIEANALMGANELESITVPTSVASIGTQAFAYCPKLKTVTIQGSPFIDQYYIGRANTNLTDIYFKGAGTTFTHAKCITFSHTEGGIAKGITVHFVNEDLKKAFEEVNSSTEMTLIVDSQA